MLRCTYLMGLLFFCVLLLLSFPMWCTVAVGRNSKKILSWQGCRSLAHQGQEIRVWWTKCTTSTIQPSQNSGFSWFSQDFGDVRVKQLPGAIRASSLPLFLSLCAICTTPTLLGIGTVALPSQPRQCQQNSHWLLCPQGQALVPISVCTLLRGQMKMHQQRHLEQANKTTRVPQTPVGIFPWGRRETTGKTQGWRSEAPRGEDRLKLGELQAVPSMVPSPTLTETPWLESLRGGRWGVTAHSHLFQSSPSQTSSTCILFVLVNSTCEITCGPKEPERAPSAPSDTPGLCAHVGALSPAHTGDPPEGCAWPL